MTWWYICLLLRTMWPICMKFWEDWKDQGLPWTQISDPWG
jgi:hypothetical protein